MGIRYDEIRFKDAVEKMASQKGMTKSAMCFLIQAGMPVVNGGARKKFCTRSDSGVRFKFDGERQTLRIADAYQDHKWCWDFSEDGCMATISSKGVDLVREFVEKLMNHENGNLVSADAEAGNKTLNNK